MTNIDCKFSLPKEQVELLKAYSVINNEPVNSIVKRAIEMQLLIEKSNGTPIIEMHNGELFKLVRNK